MHPFRTPAALLAAGLLGACGGGIERPPAWLVASTPSLTLAASGNVRLITVTNEGPLPAEGLKVSAPDLPAGSSLHSGCAAVLRAGDSCIVLIWPGAVPTAARGDPAPVPVRLRMRGTNTNALEVDITVITHGSVHQGGHVFALDDRTAITSGVGGKVLATVDTPNAHWSPTATTVPGVGADAVAGPDSCEGAVDGRCNTARILASYPSDARTYAAALCADSRHGGFADWYLPAICELGYDVPGTAHGVCGSQVAPRLRDNVRSRLYDAGMNSVLGLDYWSSTQSAQEPDTRAFAGLYFSQSSVALQKRVSIPKSRCVRAITP